MRWTQVAVLGLTVGNMLHADDSPERPETAQPLQPLVDACPEGETLRLKAGTYAGPVVLNRRITVDGMDQAILDGRGHGTVMTIKAPGARVRRLHITGSGPSHDAMDGGIVIEADGVTVEKTVIDHVLFGVQVMGARDVRICGNVISSTEDEAGLRGDGVRIWNGSFNRVEGNDVFRARDVTLANAHHNVVRGNRIREGRFGMQLVFAPRNQIEENWLDGNLTGIAALNSEEITVRHNRIQNSVGPAGSCLMLKDSSQAVVEDNAVIHCSVGAKTNAPTQPLNAIYFRRNLFAHHVSGMDFYGENGGHIIENNTFSHNLMQVTGSGVMSARGHTWSGNRWDDYEGFDRNGDGVGDVPYEIYAFADRIWMETPHAAFFRNAPVLELLDFLERLAPFANPELILRDPSPRVDHVEDARESLEREWPSFKPHCTGEEP